MDLGKTFSSNEMPDLKRNTVEKFGDAIVADINALIREENNVSIRSTDKRLNNLTYKRLRGKPYAVLFDLIGGVLYRGKYGCYPPNSQYYTHDGKPCRDRKICRCVLDCDKCVNDYKCNYKEDRVNRREYGIDRDRGKHENNKNRINNIKARCVNGDKCRIKSDNPKSDGLYICTRETCIYEERDFTYKSECRFENNCWTGSNGCYKLWGHFLNKDKELYWGPKTTQPTTDFLYSLADEAFAQMAAEAIANPTAYEYMIKYLPESYEKFNIEKFLSTPTS